MGASIEPSKSVRPDCPYCHSPLEPGVLGAANFTMLGDARWFSGHASEWTVGLPLGLGGGETVATGGAGSVMIPGHRCRRCRVMFLRY